MLALCIIAVGSAFSGEGSVPFHGLADELEGLWQAARSTPTSQQRLQRIASSLLETSAAVQRSARGLNPKWQKSLEQDEFAAKVMQRLKKDDPSKEFKKKARADLLQMDKEFKQRAHLDDPNYFDDSFKERMQDMKVEAEKPSNADKPSFVQLGGQPHEMTEQEAKSEYDKFASGIHQAEDNLKHLKFQFPSFDEMTHFPHHHPLTPSAEQFLATEPAVEKRIYAEAAAIKARQEKRAEDLKELEALVEHKKSGNALLEHHTRTTPAKAKLAHGKHPSQMRKQHK